MSKNRLKTNLIHTKNGEAFDIRKEKATGKLFIIGTNIEVQPNQVKKKNPTHRKGSNYDFSKPYIAQDLGDEWDDYPWTADDY